MKRAGKMFIVGALAIVLLIACFAFGACFDGKTPDDKDPGTVTPDDPYAGLVAYDEETAEIFRFEAEEAVITAPVALKCDAMSYQGNGHVVKAAGGFAAGHFMQSDASGSGSDAYGDSAYVGYMGAAVGDKLTFEIESAKACVANVIFQGKSSLYMGAAEDTTSRQHASMWKCDETPIYINGEKQTFDDTFFQQIVWAKNVELTGVKLKKGKNVIEIVAEKPLGTTWTSSCGDWFDGAPRSAFPDLDFISIDASVDTDNFTFSNRTFTNEINANGYYTQKVCSWVITAEDPAGFGE